MNCGIMRTVVITTLKYSLCKGLLYITSDVSFYSLQYIRNNKKINKKLGLDCIHFTSLHGYSELFATVFAAGYDVIIPQPTKFIDYSRDYNNYLYIS
jgi:hypothetical protein